MKISFIVALGLLHSVNSTFSALPEDLEGSGYDLKYSGFGSGDWSDEAGEMKNIQDYEYIIDVSPPNAGGGTKNILHGSPVLSFDGAPWSGFVGLSKSKGFLENKDILAGVIAGGAVGVAFAVALAAILINRLHKKNDEGYILGQQGASDEDFHKPKKQEVVV